MEGVTDPAALADVASKVVVGNTVEWGLVALLGGGGVLALIIACITLLAQGGRAAPSRSRTLIDPKISKQGLVPCFFILFPFFFDSLGIF